MTPATQHEANEQALFEAAGNEYDPQSFMSGAKWQAERMACAATDQPIAGQVADLVAKLVRVSRWIDKFPVPTDGATAMMCHLRDVREALETLAITPTAPQAEPSVRGELGEGDRVRTLDVDWMKGENYANKEGVVEELGPDGMSHSVTVRFDDGESVVCCYGQLTKLAPQAASQQGAEWGKCQLYRAAPQAASLEERDRRLLLDTIGDLGEAPIKARDWLAGNQEAVIYINKAISFAGIRRAPQAASQQAGPTDSLYVAYGDDDAVDLFAKAMKDKMAASRAKGRSGWHDPDQCPTERLQTMLIDHLAKGDPVDIGNFAMMLWNRGEPVADVGRVFRNDGAEPDWSAYVESEADAATTASASSLSKAQIDDIVYQCRQSGNDTTYDIVNAAIRAALARALLPAQAQENP